MFYVEIFERECPQCLLCQEKESMNKQNLAVSAVSGGQYFNCTVNSGTESYAANIEFMLYPATIRKEQEFSAGLLTLLNFIIHRQQFRLK